MKPKNAILPFLRLLSHSPKTLLKELLNYTKEADKKNYFHKKFGLTSLPYIDIQDLLVSIDEEITNYTFLDGTSRVTDLILLKALCRQFPQCHYLEIGSWRGESLLNAAQVAQKCVSLSLSKEDILGMGLPPAFAESQRLFTNGLHNVVHLEANSQTYDFGQLTDRFDVIFIDGDHSYEGVKSDTINAFKLLRDEHSVIVWHDCGNSFETQRFEVLAAILDGCTPEKRKYLFRVTNTLCGIYTTSPIKSHQQKFPQFPTKTFSVHVKSHPFPSPEKTLV